MFEVYRTIPHNAGGSKLMELLFYAENYYEANEGVCRKMIESTIFEGESF